jgi:hypothetical protein
MTILRHIPILILALLTSACSDVDDSRIPLTNVNIDLTTPGYWDLYGVSGISQYRYFIKADKTPSNFYYTALSGTGYGGVLLTMDINNNPVAYDLSCPVEAGATTRIKFNSETLTAQCPKCKSTYNVCEFNGSPTSGTAYELKYALRRYRVVPSATGGYTIRP